MFKKAIGYIAISLLAINIIVSTIVATAATAAEAAAAAAATEQEAESFVRDTADRVMDVVRSGQPREQIRERLRALFYETVDTDWMASFVLGKYKRDLDKQDLDEFKRAYKEYLGRFYVSKFKSYSGQNYEIRGSRSLGDNYFIVYTEVYGGDRPTAIEYRVRMGKSKKIVDIKAAGVSAILTQRDEYSNFLQSYDIADLIDKLYSYREEQ